jgi:DNA-binding XRE family transcriptional regulator
MCVGKGADVVREEDEKRAEVRQFLDELDAYIGPIEGTKTAGKGASEQPLPPAPFPPAERGSRPASASKERGSTPTSGSTQLRRRRVRRWGEAARKAAQDEIAEGEKAPLRSLRAIREAFPMSQAELAVRARLSRTTISAIETGRRRAHPKTCRVIARVLGVLPIDVLW